MKNKKDNDLWVVALPFKKFIGKRACEVTADIDEAYGWHYKKEALRKASDHLGSKVGRRKDFRCEDCNNTGVSYKDDKGNSDHMNAHICKCGSSGI